MEKKYLPLEANPEIIEKYVKNLGGPLNIEFVDVLGCDKELLDCVPRPVVALLLLFPIKEASEKLAKSQAEKIASSGGFPPNHIWFTKQTVGNACGTVAILHTVANIKHKAPYEKGGFFDKFFEKVKDMNPDERAKALEVDNEIEKFHAHAVNEGQSRVPDASENVDMHFVAFVEVDNHLYELDGRKKFPIDHGKTSQDTFFEDAVKVVEDVFMKNDSQEFRFSIIAVSKKK